MTAAPLPPLWRQREYMLLWTAQVSATLGGSASGIVVPLLVLAMTGSPTAAGVASALGILPYILLGLPVGVYIDRWHRQRVMVVCDVVRALATFSLVGALVMDTLTLGHLYTVAVVQGVCMVFFNLAEVAALPRVVATAQLPQAVAQNQAGHSAAAIAGPALGTWLMQHGGRALPFGVDALGHLVSAWCVARLRTPLAAHPPDPAAGPRSLRAEMAVGLRWLWQQPLVRRIAGLTCLSNFVMAAAPLMVIVLAKELGASEAQIGLVFSAGGVGGLLGALTGGWIAQRFSFGQVIVGTLALQAAMLPMLAWAPGPLALAAAYAVLAFCGPVYNVVQLSRRLAMIPDGLQGRVNSAFRCAASALHPAGTLLCGVLAEHFGGVVTALCFTAVMAVLAVAARGSRVVWREGRAG